LNKFFCFVTADETNKASKIDAEGVAYWLCSELMHFFQKTINFNGKFLSTCETVAWLCSPLAIVVII